MTHNEPTGALTGEPGFPPSIPQRIAGGTFPATDDTTEAVRTRGDRHIEVEEEGR